MITGLSLLLFFGLGGIMPDFAMPGSRMMIEDRKDEFYFAGTATMLDDRTIVLDLVSNDNGVVAHGRLTYPPDHPRYDSILEHIGELHPGQTKPVKPWPD